MHVPRTTDNAYRDIIMENGGDACFPITSSMGSIYCTHINKHPLHCITKLKLPITYEQKASLEIRHF